jgi:hypothetical protein
VGDEAAVGDLGLELSAGESDLVLCVLHGVVEVHGSPSRDAVVEDRLAAYFAEMVDDGGEVEDPAEVAVAAAGAGEVAAMSGCSRRSKSTARSANATASSPTSPARCSG